MSSSTVIPLHVSLDAMETQALDKAALEDFSSIVVNGESNEMMNNFPFGALSQPPSIHSPTNSARRVLSGRSLITTKSMLNDNTDLEDGEAEKDGEKSARKHGFIKLRNQALLSGIAYCLSSCGMILVNKAVLSSYKFDAGISLMFYQNLVGVVIVIALSFFRLITTEPLTWKLIKVWFPVNVIFVGMLLTSIFSLKYINVAMVTILKNVTNIITAIGEVYLFKKKHNNKVWTALFLMIISAICGGITDLSFHAVGYAWQILNCLLTASYSLTLRRLMDVAKQVTKSGNLNEFSMVLLNNSLSLPLLIINLVTYFTGFMHMEIAESANTLTNFMGTTFLLSLLGGIVSDSCINRFKTSVLTASIELSGYIILLVQAHYDTLKPPPCIAFDPACVKVSGSKAGMLFIGLYLIAIGNGGLKAALPALGADQFDVRDPHERKNIPTYFNMFFFSLSLGAALGVTVVVWVQNNEGWDAGFGISAGAVFISIICIVAGITTYRNRVPGGSPLTRIAQVFVAAFHNRKLTTPEDAHELYESHDNETDVHSEKLLHTSQFKILDKAALLVDNSCQSKKKMEDMSPWHLCSVTQVEETKILIRMIPVFASTIVMNACLAQLQTFSVSQGVTMDRSMGKHFNIPAASVPIISLVFMLILTPLYDRCFVPFARRFTGLEAGITHLQRIGFGLFLSGISMAIAALVEVKRKNVARNNGMLDAIPLLMPPLPISVFWLGFQYFVFGIADLFTFVGLMEFFYSEAPAGMRSLATAFSWTSFSLGYFLSTILVDIVNASTRNITESHGWLRGNNLNRNHLNLFYWLLTILSMLNFFTYLLCSSWYKYKAVVVCQLSDDASAIHHANDPNNSLNKGNGRSHGRGHILV